MAKLTKRRSRHLDFLTVLRSTCLWNGLLIPLGQPKSTSSASISSQPAFRTTWDKTRLPGHSDLSPAASVTVPVVPLLTDARVLSLGRRGWHSRAWAISGTAEQWGMQWWPVVSKIRFSGRHRFEAPLVSCHLAPVLRQFLTGTASVVAIDHETIHRIALRMRARRGRRWGHQTFCQLSEFLLARRSKPIRLAQP